MMEENSRAYILAFLDAAESAGTFHAFARRRCQNFRSAICSSFDSAGIAGDALLVRCGRTPANGGRRTGLDGIDLFGVCATAALLPGARTAIVGL